VGLSMLAFAAHIVMGLPTFAFAAHIVVGLPTLVFGCPRHHGAAYARVQLPTLLSGCPRRRWGTICPHCMAYVVVGLSSSCLAARVVVGAVLAVSLMGGWC